MGLCTNLKFEKIEKKPKFIVLEYTNTGVICQFELVKKKQWLQHQPKLVMQPLSLRNEYHKRRTGKEKKKVFLNAFTLFFFFSFPVLRFDLWPLPNMISPGIRNEYHKRRTGKEKKEVFLNAFTLFFFSFPVLRFDHLVKSPKRTYKYIFIRT